MSTSGYLVLETGEVFEGVWSHLGSSEAVGEVVFNTSHHGFEEIATDPSYYSQILVMTAPMQGNYGSDPAARWESRQLWIRGFCCVEMQRSERESSWLKQLEKSRVPVLSDLDTRKLVIRLREKGTPWGAMVVADSPKQAESLARERIREEKAKLASKDGKDWVYQVTRPTAEKIPGSRSGGPRVAVLDLGVKENTLRELSKRCSEVMVFPSRVLARTVQEYEPDGILLSNGPGDPKDVVGTTETVRQLLGWRPIFGICMGNQILALALNGSTKPLKFGHRGGNHPVRDELLGEIYVTSQNHGYVVDAASLDSSTRVTHWNLYDKTVEGIECASKKCFSVQYHPESRPGPHDASKLFDLFVDKIK